MNELLALIAPFWIWLTLAFLFLSIEVVIIPSGFFLCLGTSAAITALLSFFLSSLSWLWMLAIFASLAVVACYGWWVLLRKKGKLNRSENPKLNVKTAQIVGYQAVLTADIKAGRGHLRINDSPWPVEAEKNYPAGTKVEVTEIHGIILKVRAVQ